MPYPNDPLSVTQPPTASLRRLIGPLSGIKRSGTAVLCLAIALEVCQLVSPLFMRLVVDKVVRVRDEELLIALAIVFAGIATTQSILSLARAHTLIVFSQRVKIDWLSNLFSRMVSLPMPFFNERSVGQVSAKFWSVMYIHRVLTVGFVEGVLDGVMAVVTLSLLFYLSPVIALVCIGYAIAYSILRYLLRRRQSLANAVRADMSIIQQSRLWEVIAGIQTVKLGLYHAISKKRWMNSVVLMFEGDRVYESAEALVRACGLWLGAMERILVLTYGARHVLDSSISLGTFFALAAYNELFIARVAGLVDKLIELSLLGVHRDKVAELALAAPERDAGTCMKQPITAANASLEVKSASVSFDGGQRFLFRDVSLSVRPGECVVITGPSGCGKTTLMKAMLGLLPLGSGAVIVGGHDINSVRRADFYGVVASVLREDRLFTGTVAENISMFAPYHDQAWAEECAAAVDLHYEVFAMESGYNTSVKDDGVLLSAGQRQRLLLARALYRRPQIIFLDEATSHLDSPREAQFLSHLASSLITRIIVTHQAGPLMAADRIYGFRDGTLAEVSLEEATTGTVNARRTASLKSGS